MATIGLRDLFFAPVEMVGGLETYGEVKRLAKAIKAEMSVETTDAILYADDGVDVSIKEFVKGTLKLNVNDLEPKDVALLLGQDIGENGITFAGENDEPPYVAIAFRAKKPEGGNKYRYIWLYKVKFKIPNESFETKGSSVNFATPELEGEFIKREKDGKWKADYTGVEANPTADSWFDEVVEAE